MRTNIVIDDALLADAMHASGSRTKREAVERGLQALVRLRKQQDIRNYRGGLDWQGDLEVMRTNR